MSTEFICCNDGIAPEIIIMCNEKLVLLSLIFAIRHCTSLAVHQHSSVCLFFQDVPTKITIGKTLGGSSGSNLLQKTAMLARGTITTPSLVPVNNPTTQGNVIVVDLSPESSSVSNNNALADILQATGILGSGGGGPSSVDSGNLAAPGTGAGAGDGGQVGKEQWQAGPRAPLSSSLEVSLSWTESTSTSMATTSRSNVTTCSQSSSQYIFLN